MCCIVLLFTAVTALAGRVFGVLRRELRAYARLCLLKLLTDTFLKVTIDWQKYVCKLCTLFCT